jgi:menaquinol-cytochrome c reductase iron-sulfur subunit
MTSDTGEKVPRLSRRGFVMRLLTVVGAGIAAALAIPIAGFAAAPGWTTRGPLRFLSMSVAPTLRSDEWTKVGAVSDFEVGTPKYLEVDRHVVDGWVTEDAPIGVHVVRETDTDVAVFDPHCTHLGCPLSWSDGSHAFVCPCHGGSFDQAGTVLSGPPPRPMIRYQTKVEGGQIFIGKLIDGI